MAPADKWRAGLTQRRLPFNHRRHARINSAGAGPGGSEEDQRKLHTDTITRPACKLGLAQAAFLDY
jgi:hypothetical protein